MTFKNQPLACAAVLFFFATVAHAETMYQCLDANGHKSFSNIKTSANGTKCTPMDLGPVLGPADASPASGSSSRPATKTPTPPTFPRVADDAQKNRDNDRKRILEGELAAEQKNLEQAQEEFAKQDATRLGNESNFQKKIDRLQPHKDKVDLHSRNIEAIQKEISKLR